MDGDGVGPGVPELLPFPVPLAVIPFELLLCGESVPVSLLLSPLAEEATTPIRLPQSAPKKNGSRFAIQRAKPMVPAIATSKRAGFLWAV